MYVNREILKTDLDLVINEIETDAIKRLKSDLKSIGSSTLEVNSYNKILSKIKFLSNLESKEKIIKFFLIDNYQFYKNNLNTPLNTFFLNCGKILKKYFM